MGSSEALLGIAELWQKRQGAAEWGRHYEPAIRAVVGEAPSGSGAYLLNWHRMRRELHALSGWEFFALLLALYCPWVIDILEQRVLWPWQTPHPLDGSPYYTSMQPLPPLPGIYAIADQMGRTKELVKYRIPASRTQSGKPALAPMPMVGDELLVVDKGSGPYCVNWTIKANRKAFEEPAFASLARRKSGRGIYKERFRHAVEQAYYAGGDIRTVRISGEDFDRTVFANLSWLYSAGEAPSPQTPALQELEDRLREGLRKQIAPKRSFEAVQSRYRCDDAFCTSVAKRMVWERRLLVDLYSAVLWDQPLTPMSRDVLDHYGHWFDK